MENNQTSYYFAFGSNMSKEQMKKRCPNAKKIGKAVLHNHKIGFTRNSKTWNCGTADILVSPGDEVWGVLYSITEEELQKLDIHEGVHQNAHKRSLLTVELHRISDKFFDDLQDCSEEEDKVSEVLSQVETEYVYFEKKEAFIYEVVNKNYTLYPSTEYLDIMLDAAFEYVFPGNYTELISSYGKKDVEIKSAKAIDYLLLLKDIVNNDSWPKEVSKEPEWAGGELVITNDPARKEDLNKNYPLDLVILTPHWQKISWLVRNIYQHPSMKWQINYRNKYAILDVLGRAMEEYQAECPNDNDEKGICEALIVRAYEILTH